MTLPMEYQVGPAAYTIHRWQGREAKLAELFRSMCDSHLRQMRPDPTKRSDDPVRDRIIKAELAHREWRQWAAVARQCGRGPRVVVNNTEGVHA